MYLYNSLCGIIRDLLEYHLTLLRQKGLQPSILGVLSHYCRRIVLLVLQMCKVRFLVRTLMYTGIIVNYALKNDVLKKFLIDCFLVKKGVLNINK